MVSGVQGEGGEEVGGGVGGVHHAPHLVIAGQRILWVHLPDVDLKVVPLGVGLGAVGTDKGTHARVDNTVTLQLPLRRKTLATLNTLIVVTFSFQLHLFILASNQTSIR